MSQDARRDEEQSTLRRARVLGYAYYDTYSSAKNKFPGVLSVEQIKSLKIVPLEVNPEHILFGLVTTTSQSSQQFIRDHFLDQKIDFSIISDSGYREYLQIYDPPPEVKYQNIQITNSETDQLVQNISNLLQQVKADDMLAYLVQQAHQLNASDIHLETGRGMVRIRFRIDGVLHPIANLSTDKYRVLIAAIASAGNVSTASTEAQQGHIAQKVTMADGSIVDVNVRLETVQTIHGMDVVMRLFNLDEQMYNLDRLGLSNQERAVVDDIIKKPSGLVMIVGPTGSGKTTTLYSMLNSLNNDQRKIITVEDPVENEFAGISQIPIHLSDSHKDNFADRLRAILRLDPDIIMVGEIRDMDTARTALQAALTGHLVLSTFHAASASAAMTRLADIIGQNPLFVSAIRLVMAQRLLRRLDPETKVPYQPSQAEWNKLSEIIGSISDPAQRPDLSSVAIYGPGKSESNPFGYKGQIAVREQFILTTKIRELIERPTSIIPAEEIEAAAVADGMVTIVQDAAIKVVQGETSLEELFRVLG